MNSAGACYTKMRIDIKFQHSYNNELGWKVMKGNNCDFLQINLPSNSTEKTKCKHANKKK